MIKLNCGISRKVGEPGFGSRGASVNVELELESSAAQDPGLLNDRIHALFDLARRAVYEELALAPEPKRSEPSAQQQPPVQSVGSPATTPGGSSDAQKAPSRPATAAQLRAIRTLCSKAGLDPDTLVRERLDLDLLQLSLQQASGLIDNLKGQPNSAR